MLDESICHFRGVRSILLLLLYFWQRIMLANTVDLDQMQHHLASDLDLHCLPITLFTGFQVRLGYNFPKPGTFMPFFSICWWIILGFTGSSTLFQFLCHS